MTSFEPLARPERMHVIVDLPGQSVEASTAFWASPFGWAPGEPWPDHPEFLTFEPPHGTAYVSRREVGANPGVHLELEVTDLTRGADRLVGLGAREVHATGGWRTFTSPGGLAFCLLRATTPWVGPAAVTWPTRHRSRLVQVCIDSPPKHHDREVEFWRAVTGWRWAPGDRPEFAGKLYPKPGSAVQLLLHRLGDDDRGATVRAHLDLGTDDLELEAGRLVGLGATRLWDGNGWITLRDPAGMLFCVTGNSPGAP